MGNYISKELYDLERYKLILEIDDMAQEITALKVKVIEQEKIIFTLQQRYILANQEIYTQGEFYNLYD